VHLRPNFQYNFRSNRYARRTFVIVAVAKLVALGRASLSCLEETGPALSPFFSIAGGSNSGANTPVRMGFPLRDSVRVGVCVEFRDDVRVTIDADTDTLRKSWSLMKTWISCTAGFEGSGWSIERKRDPRAMEVNQSVVRKNSRARLQGIKTRFCGQRLRR
jgi:hypothetical protein